MASTNGSDPSRATMLYYAGCEEHHYEPHFLKSCFLCNKPLGFNSDIFMYRGDTPFCSKECREEQIEIDESKDKSWKLSSRSSSSSRKSESKRKTVRTDTVAVA